MAQWNPYGHTYTKETYVEPAVIKSQDIYYTWDGFRVPIQGETYLGTVGKVCTAQGKGVYPQHILTSKRLRYFAWDKWVYDREDEDFALKCNTKKEALGIKERLNKPCVQ